MNPTACCASSVLPRVRPLAAGVRFGKCTFEQIRDFQDVRPAAEMIAVGTGQDLQDPRDIRPLALGDFSARPEPLEFGEDCILRGGHEELRSPGLVEGHRASAFQRLLIESRPRGEHVHLEHGREVDQVERTTELDGRSHATFVDVVSALKAGDEGPDMLGSEVGDQVHVDAGARDPVRGAGHGSAEVVPHLERVENLHHGGERRLDLGGQGRRAAR